MKFSAMGRLARAVIFLLASVAMANAATLLPNGKQQFLDSNGAPLAGGQVYFYVPGTSTPKNTYQDSAQTILNSNPVILDAAGRAVIYGSGTYEEQLFDASNNLIWDQVTADTSASSQSFAGTSAGTANAQTVSAANFTSSNGQVISFIAGFTNTSSLSLNVNGTGALAVYKDTAAGSVALSGGEVHVGAVTNVTYDSTLGAFHLLVPVPAGSAAVTLASATTTNLGSASSNIISISGTTTINSFGSSASLNAPIYFVTFSGALTLTYNATSMIIPGAQNKSVAAGDSLIAQYLGSGNWQVISYTSAAGFPVPQVTVITSGSGTYTVPAGAAYLEVEMIGAGSGGGGSGGSPGVGAAGGATTFGTTFLTAAGGSATPAAGTSTYPTAAAATGGDLNIAGGLGGGSNTLNSGNAGTGFSVPGASSPLGAGGPGEAEPGLAAAGNATGYGAGGGGGGYNVNAVYYSGWGGNAGAYLKKLITSPSATYAYSVGSGGTGGTAGTSGGAGGNGSGGMIRIIARFQ